MSAAFSLAGKKIWVAGHTGLVGGATLRRVQTEDCEVLTASHADLDLTRKSETQEWIAAHKPDAIILAAAKVGGIGANATAPADFLSINLSIAQNVIEAAYRHNVSKLLFLGSSCIYPKLTKQPISEDALLTGSLEQTNEAYALAKIAGLKLCQFYRQQYGCNFISAMPTNLYGPGDRFDAQTSHVIPALMLKMHRAKLSRQELVEIWGSGSALREFLYVDDLADALVFLLKQYSDPQPINIGSGQEISIANLAALMQEITGFQGNLIFNAEKPDGSPRKLLDGSRLSRLGWNAVTDLRTGLEKTYRWFCDQGKTNKAA